MATVRKTEIFDTWLTNLKDIRARARIEIRIRRLSLGNLGDIKPVGEGVSELRIDYGPGYRIYITSSDKTIVVLLCGGDKKSQRRDITLAKELARLLKE